MGERSLPAPTWQVESSQEPGQYSLLLPGTLLLSSSLWISSFIPFSVCRLLRLCFMGSKHDLPDETPSTGRLASQQHSSKFLAHGIELAPGLGFTQSTSCPVGYDEGGKGSFCPLK